MKSILILSAFIVFLSCNNDKTTTENKTTTSDTALNSNATTDQPSEKKDLAIVKAALEQMTPISETELKAKLPAEIRGAPASGISVDPGMGALLASAKYQLTDTSSVSVDIVDCAGAGGAGYFSYQYSDNTDTGGPDSETTFEVSQFKGWQAFESCIKYRPVDCVFTWFNGERYLVHLQGTNTGIELLKQIAGELSIR